MTSPANALVIATNDHKRQPVIVIARFHCGCIYRKVSDQIVYCPQHREILTGVETIRLPYDRTGSDADCRVIRNLQMSQTVPGLPIKLHNSDMNSLHQESIIQDPSGQEWERDTEELGICPACYIDTGQVEPTRISQCECGHERCYYRWCGATSGLHAYWSLHAAGLTRQATGIQDSDIFSYGSAREQTKMVQAALSIERKYLQEAAEVTTAAMMASKYPLPPWLERLRQDRERRPRELLAAALRIHVIRTAKSRTDGDWSAGSEDSEHEVPKGQLMLLGN